MNGNFFQQVGHAPLHVVSFYRRHQNLTEMM